MSDSRLISLAAVGHLYICEYVQLHSTVSTLRELEERAHAERWITQKQQPIPFVTLFAESYQPISIPPMLICSPFFFWGGGPENDTFSDVSIYYGWFRGYTMFDYFSRRVYGFLDRLWYIAAKMQFGRAPPYFRVIQVGEIYLFQMNIQLLDCYIVQGIF